MLSDCGEDGIRYAFGMTGGDLKALTAALNGMFSFWGPFCCWIIIGLIAGIDGYALAPIQWAAAIVMIIGIFFIAMNPLDLFRKKNTEEA